ncbi:prepilin peptidase [Planctomicrobium sp. SH664]|uniref:prepilin peptidase n=1 Tax=Planctomicrobium sp. SH664 TaxID=3448125 RepID=UPI003F5BCF5B
MTLRLDLPLWFIDLGLFLLGAVVGSFLNVCIYRIPTRDRLRDQLASLWEKPSNCPRCRTPIRWYDNLPIFGWLKLRGRCRACRMWISPRYPLIEFLNACLWVLVFHLEVPTGMFAPLSSSCLDSDLGPQVFPGLGPLSVEQFVLLRYFFHMVLIEALLVASMIDFDLRIIPDGTTVPAMIVAVVASTAIGRLNIVPVWFQSPNLEMSFASVTPKWIHPLLSGPGVPAWISAHPHLHGLAVSLAGFVIGGGIVWLVRILGHWMLKQEAMGFGDVILMAMVGSFLGWQPTVIAFFIAPLFAILVVAVTSLFRRDRMIPYGPYLSLGTLATLLAWKPIFARTRHIFELGALLLPLVGLGAVVFGLSLLLVQALKRLIGWQTTDVAPPIWRSADQTWFFKGENVNRHACRWPTRDWEGCASGQGTRQAERWRGNGSTGSRSWGRGG